MNTVLRLEASSAYIDVIFLIRKETLLMMASFAQVDAVAELIKLGVNVNIIDNYGQRVLHRVVTGSNI